MMDVWITLKVKCLTRKNVYAHMLAYVRTLFCRFNSEYSELEAEYRATVDEVSCVVWYVMLPVSMWY